MELEGTARFEPYGSEFIGGRRTCPFFQLAWRNAKADIAASKRVRMFTKRFMNHDPSLRRTRRSYLRLGPELLERRLALSGSPISAIGGNWDGQAGSSVGLYDSGSGQFYLRNA